MRGATDVAIFTGIMTSDVYQRILDEYHKPFVSSVYPGGHRLWQDNDPKHISRSTVKWMNENSINHWPTPPESPDLNPIERLSAALKYHIRRRTKPTNKDELTQGIRDFWATVDPAMCARYIRHIPKAAKLIVANAGGPAWHWKTYFDKLPLRWVQYNVLNEYFVSSKLSD